LPKYQIIWKIFKLFRELAISIMIEENGCYCIPTDIELVAETH